MRENRMGSGPGDPLDAYLDGAVDRAALPEDIRREEEALARALASLDASMASTTSVRDDVMRRIDALPRSRWNDLVDWCLRPRTISVTPATAGGFAVAAVALLLLGWPLGDRGAMGVNGSGPGATGPAAGSGSPAARTAATTPAEAPVLTRFVFVAPEANRVTLTGDWLGWDPDRVELVQHRESGIWTVEVPVPAGVHEYSFVVDDREWRPDPLAGSQAEDGFGRTNSVLMVSRSEV